MNSIYFSNWLLDSLEKDLFKDLNQQNIAEKIRREIIERSTSLKKHIIDKKDDEIDFSRQSFEISWNNGIHEISVIKNLQFRTITNSMVDAGWGHRCFVEGKVVWDTWVSYPSRRSWIHICHSLLRQNHGMENYVWIVDLSKLGASTQSEIMLLAPSLHPISKKLNSIWIIGESQFFPKSFSWWGVPFHQSLNLQKPFSSIGLLTSPEEDSRWARRKRHWKRAINDWKKTRPEIIIDQGPYNWDEPRFNWQEFSQKDQTTMLQDLLSWLKPN